MIRVLDESARGSHEKGNHKVDFGGGDLAFEPCLRGCKQREWKGLMAFHRGATLSSPDKANALFLDYSVTTSEWTRREPTSTPVIVRSSGDGVSVWER